MIRSHKSPLRFLTASLLVGGLLFASIANAIEILVEPKTEPAIKLEVQATDTIGTVKDQIEAKSQAGFPPELQVLQYEGKKLENDKTIADYAIEQGATLQLEMTE